MQAQFYRPNADKVAAEIIDDEAIIINVATGNYYNTEGIGGWVWEQCVAGKGLDEITRLAVDRFDAKADVMRNDLDKFFASMEEEELVTGSDEGMATGATVQPAAARTDVTKATYQAPRLMAYRDLKDLLALDPPMPRLGAERLVSNRPGATPTPSR